MSSPSLDGTSDAERTTSSYHEGVSAVDPTSHNELVVAEDGSIPAEQLARLGLGPGAHLRVVEATQPVSEPTGLRGSLPDFPDLDWDAFERASELARRDLASS
jgi:hypothetical protein